MHTYAEQIAAFEAKHAANVAAMEAIMSKAASEGSTLDASQQDEFDGLQADNDAIVGHLKRLKTLEKSAIANAKPVVTEAKAAERPTSIIVKNPKIEKGVPFIRMVSALAQTEGNWSAAAEIARKWSDSTPEVEQILRTPKEVIKAAVDAGNTTSTTWAAPLVQYNNLASEFVDYLRPMTILGRINGFRRVPFKTKVPRQTGGASVNWVGEGKVKPLTSLAFDSITLDHHKVAGIIPVTEELMRLSSPSAEMLVRDDLAAAIGQFIDAQFLDVTKASNDVSPASITYGVSVTTATGTTASAFRADVKSMMASLLTANQQVAGGTWVMTQQQALALSLMINDNGSPMFPGISPMGGTLLGFPVVASENITAAGSSPVDGYPIYFVLPGEILLADDGGVTVDISREASVQMETTPDSPFTASTTMVSFWQHNLVGVRVERYITWKVRRSSAVGIIQGAKYAE